MLDLNLATRSSLAHADTQFQNAPARSILAVGIEVPGREKDIHRVMRRLKSSTRHHLDIAIAQLAPGKGKFENIQSALDRVNLDHYEWLVIVDDDVAFRRNMLDRLIGFSEACDFVVAQPAHRLSSYASYAVTLRRAGCFARQTRFVEIGPLTVIRRPAFPKLIPFPKSRWCYGIDLMWSHTVRAAGWKMGIVDACPIGHLRPVAGSYSMDEARAEGAELVQRLGFVESRQDILGWEEVASPL